jgi:glycosyltransferase involved in cell wall biosynthesis
LRFLFWTDGFWPRIGGIETQGYHFIEGMLKKGHEGLVIAQIDGPQAKEEEVFNGIRIKRFDFNRVFPAQELSRLRGIETYLEWVAKEFKPDIIHLNACVGWHGFIFLLFRKIFKVPFVATIHAPFFYQNEINPLLEKISLHADFIGCVSKWVLQETEKLIPEFKRKLKLVYNGLPLPDLTPSPLPFSPALILLVGRFTHEKGFKTAILAFSFLKNPKARLMIAGSGVDRDSMEQQVQELGIENSVDFMGPFKKSEMPALINQATLVVVPSYFESFGLVALESMQMGRPVIASSVGGLQEIVCHGETGLLVPPRDANALSVAIGYLMDHPEKAKKMGDKGRKRSEELFTLRQNVEQYESIYQELLRK